MKRLLSLDFFRGITIAAMILVNTPGSWIHVYSPLRHAVWHGITPTDLIFPFFLFIVGVSISISFRKKIIISKTVIFKKILRRTFVIFMLGIFLSLFPDFIFSDLRVVGVLQRIAIVYLACSIVFIYFNTIGQLIIGGLILISYWILMMYVPFNGNPAGTIEPGKNFAAWIDSFIVPGRLYEVTWDPEGLFSTISAIATGISGIISGKIIKLYTKKIQILLSIGLIMIIVSLFWNKILPINKHIWTSSYVLFTSGLAMIILSFAIWIIDLKKYTSYIKFSLVFGSNAITAYVLHGILWKFFQLKISGDLSLQELWMLNGIEFGLSPKLVSLGWAIFYTLVIYFIIYQLYKRKIYIKV